MLFSLTLLFGLPLFLSGSSASQSSQIALTLVASPPILPADGGTYQALVLEFKNVTSGLPYIPTSNLTIQLSSTNLQTATVPTDILFTAGSLFEIVNVTTTASAGQTIVNAFMAGYSPASTTVTTELTGGMPASLKVFMTPAVTPPNQQIRSLVSIVVLDSLGNPVKLGSPLTITLSSSDSQVGSVPGSITIPAGASYRDADFTPTYVAGETSITASAPGLSAGSAVMTTVGPVARKLVVTVAPSVILDTGDYATVAIQLFDNTSLTPALASSSGVNLFVTSNSTGVAIVTNAFPTIPAGQSYALVNVTSGGSVGAANITVSGPGYLKGSAIVSSVAPGGNPANWLSLSFLPGTLLPNSQVYSDGAVVQLQYRSSPSASPTPVTAGSGGVQAYARSSDNATMFAQTTPISIAQGATHGFATITSTYLPGTASIIVSQSGYNSDEGSLTSSGLNPDAISISTGSALLLADGESYNLTIGLINKESGNPAIASAPTVVNLASTSSVVGTIAPTATIPAGQSFITVSFVSSGLPGSTEITATSSNAASTNVNLTLIDSQATNLAIYATPGTIIANGKAYDNLVVQLQDVNHNPVKTDVPLNISLTSSSGLVSSIITVQTGQTFANASVFSTLSAGQINVTAFRNGFEYAQANITQIVLPLKASLTLSKPDIPLSGRANATVSVEANGAPLAGAFVSWQATAGTLSGAENTTNSLGTATATFTGTPSPATVRIYAQISDPGYETLNVNATIQVSAPQSTPPVKPSTSFFGVPYLGMTFLSVPLWAIIAIAGGGAGGGFFAMRRFRGGGFQYQDEE